MRVEDLAQYNKGFSEAEGSWTPETKAKMKREGMRVILSHIPWLARPRFLALFVQGKRKAGALELEDLRARGLSHEGFLRQQLEYLAVFWALAHLYDTERAVAIMKEVMDVSAREPLLACLPRPENVRAVGEPIEVFRDYFRVVPEAAERAGCNEITVSEDEPGIIEFRVSWCVWLELAERMGIPQACQPNCYSDDLVFPEYFAELGIEYGRTQTLACGGTCCDFRFQRKG